MTNQGTGFEPNDLDIYTTVEDPIFVLLMLLMFKNAYPTYLVSNISLKSSPYNVAKLGYLMEFDLREGSDSLHVQIISKTGHASITESQLFAKDVIGGFDNPVCKVAMLCISDGIEFMIADGTVDEDVRTKKFSIVLRSFCPLAVSYSRIRKHAARGYQLTSVTFEDGGTVSGLINVDDYDSETASETMAYRLKVEQPV